MEKASSKLLTRASQSNLTTTIVYRVLVLATAVCFSVLWVPITSATVQFLLDSAPDFVSSVSPFFHSHSVSTSSRRLPARSTACGTLDARAEATRARVEGVRFAQVGMDLASPHGGLALVRVWQFHLARPARLGGRALPCDRRRGSPARRADPVKGSNMARGDE